MTTITTETKGKTLIITINRPEVMNALNKTVLQELEQAILQLHGNAELAGAIITGAGEKAFVAGADIAEINQIPDEKAGETLSKKGQSIFNLIENGPKPVIAAVNGFALGGGCELAMACHMRVAAENARFGQPEVNLGLIPGYGGTQRLPRLIGLGKANELLLTGDMIKAPEALSLGLANHMVPADQLMAKCEEILEKIYSKSPLAISLTMEATIKGVYNPATGQDNEAYLFGKATSSNDGKEGTAAFLEKRKADFKGN